MQLLDKLKRKPKTGRRKALTGIPVTARGRGVPVVYPRRDSLPKKPRKSFLRKVLERVRALASFPRALRRPTADTGPKNGWLVAGLLGSVVMTAVLGTLSVRLIRDPSVATKAFGRSLVAQTDVMSREPARCPAAPIAQKSPGDNPPQVTFYSKLRQEERPPDPEPIAGKIDEKDLATPAREGSTPAETAKPAEKTDARPRQATQDAARGAASASEGRSRESMGSGKVYSVQVGAFSHPGVAKQWAEKWRARGYDVILKPVARPRSGIIYRLYLGSFPTAKKADELVGRLKAKEGVTAFAVALR